MNNAKQTSVRLIVKQAKTLFEKTIGLIRTSEPSNLLLKTRFGIHTFGMKYSIDVIVLNKDNIVKALKENLQPNRIFVWNPLYEIVIELRPGTIHEKNIFKNTHVMLTMG